MAATSTSDERARRLREEQQLSIRANGKANDDHPARIDQEYSKVGYEGADQEDYERIRAAQQQRRYQELTQQARRASQQWETQKRKSAASLGSAQTPASGAGRPQGGGPA